MLASIVEDRFVLQTLKFPHNKKVLTVCSELNFKVKSSVEVLHMRIRTKQTDNKCSISTFNKFRLVKCQQNNL